MCENIKLNIIFDQHDSTICPYPTLCPAFYLSSLASYMYIYKLPIY